jgi:hypothetical protein
MINGIGNSRRGADIGKLAQKNRCPADAESPAHTRQLFRIDAWQHRALPALRCL